MIGDFESIENEPMTEEEKLIKFIRTKEKLIKEISLIHFDENATKEILEFCSQLDDKFSDLNRLSQYKKQFHDSLIEKINHQKSLFEKRLESINNKIKGKKKKSVNLERSQSNLKILQEIK